MVTYIKCLFTIVCLLPFTNIFAITTLEQYERLWDEKKYEELIPILTEVRKNLVSPSLRLRADYIMGTSMCRVDKYKNYGYKLLDMIPYIYRHLSNYNYRIIISERNNCNGTQKILAKLSYDPPGVSGKGDWRLRREDIAVEEGRFMDRLKEFNERIVELQSTELNSKLDQIKALAGKNYNAIAKDFFIVVGHASDKDLLEKTKLLNDTLKRFLTQFKMKTPEFYTTVYLMPTSADMVAFATRNHDIRVSNSMWGYTFPYDSSVVINIQGGLGTVGHEVFHVLLNQNYPDSPPWLNEGYSSLFEEFNYDDEKMIGTYRSSHWRIKYLNSKPSTRTRPSIRELITMNWRDFEPMTENRLHQNHTTAKFFAMFLQNKKKKLEKVYQIFQTTDFRNSVGDLRDMYIGTLEKALDGESVDSIESQFQAWLINDLRIEDNPLENTPQEQIPNPDWYDRRRNEYPQMQQ